MNNSTTNTYETKREILNFARKIVTIHSQIVTIQSNYTKKLVKMIMSI